MVLWYTYIYRGFMAIPDGTDDMGRTTIQVSDELADELHERKGRGDSYEDVVWRLIRGSEDPSSERDPQGETVQDGVVEPSARPDETHAVRDDAEHVLRELGLPGRGDDLEARIEALLAIHDLLREREGERVTADQLKDVADDYSHGYADADSFWSNCVKKNSAQDRPNALKALPGVREAGSGEYTYEGGGDA
jgi:hypothetical protein